MLAVLGSAECFPLAEQMQSDGLTQAWLGQARKPGLLRLLRSSGRSILTGCSSALAVWESVPLCESLDNREDQNVGLGRQKSLSG